MKLFTYTILISSFILTQELSSRYHDIYEIEEKIIQLVKEDQISLPRRPEWRGY